MIKLERDEEGDWLLGKNAFVHLTNDWTQFYRLLTGKTKYNWYTFDFIKVYFENDVMCPGFEIEVALFGFGLRFRYNRSWEGSEIQSRIDEMEKARQTGELIPGGFDGRGEFTEDLEAALKALICKARQGMMVCDQEALAAMINKTLKSDEIEEE